MYVHCVCAIIVDENGLQADNWLEHQTLITERKKETCHLHYC